jgi:hypothetical protein
MKICDEDAVAEFFIEGTIDDFEWCDETKQQWFAILAPDDSVQSPPAPCWLRLDIVDRELGIRRKRRGREILYYLGGPGAIGRKV